MNIFQCVGFVIFLIYFTWDHNCIYLLLHDVLLNEMSQLSGIITALYSPPINLSNNGIAERPLDSDPSVSDDHIVTSSHNHTNLYYVLHAYTALVSIVCLPDLILISNLS